MKVTDIKAYTTEEEAMIIKQIIKKHRPKQVLEIGSFHGFMSYNIALALEELNNDSLLISIDINNNAESEHHDLYNHFVIDKKIVHFIVGDANHLIKDYAQHSEIIFIDGNYSKLGLQTMWNYIHNNKKTRIVLFHDVLCADSEQLYCNSFFIQKKEFYKSQLFETKDTSGNLNGIGVLFLNE